MCVYVYSDSAAKESRLWLSLFGPHGSARQFRKQSISHSVRLARNTCLLSRVLGMNNAKRMNLVITSLRHSNFIMKFPSSLLTLKGTDY